MSKIAKIEIDCGRMGSLQSTLIVTETGAALLRTLIAKKYEFRFGEVLGKYSDVRATIEPDQVEWIPVDDAALRAVVSALGGNLDKGWYTLGGNVDPLGCAIDYYRENNGWDKSVDEFLDSLQTTDVATFNPCALEDEVELLYWDKPLIWLGTRECVRYLVIYSDFTDMSESYLSVRIKPDVEAALLGKTIGVYEVFKNTSNKIVYRTTFGEGGAITTTEVPVADIPDDELPEPGAFLA